MKVLAIPDTHFPWCDQKALSKVYDAIEDLKPELVIQLGDVLDLYSWSRFARSLDVMTPKEELEAGIADYRVFWKTIRKIVGPKKRLIQLGGNHTDRLVKTAINKAPELAHLINIKHALSIDCVEVYEDSRAEIEIDGVLYIHGWMNEIGKHARYFNQSVVHGHTHAGGLWTQNLKKKCLFELDCGYLADPYQVPLIYRATKTTNWTKGFGFIDEWGPRFCPL